jgi:hypothetical protein
MWYEEQFVLPVPELWCVGGLEYMTVALRVVERDGKGTRCLG